MKKIYTHNNPMFAVATGMTGCYHLWLCDCVCMSETKNIIESDFTM